MADFNIRTVIPFAPLNDSVLVLLDREETETESGILLDQAHSLVAEAIPSGVIVAVGPDAPEYLNPGSLVLCRKYTGTEVVVNGELYHEFVVSNIVGLALDPAQFVEEEPLATPDPGQDGPQLV
jgi:co-chaperonin GroES (HSP10)